MCVLLELDFKIIFNRRALRYAELGAENAE